MGRSFHSPRYEFFRSLLIAARRKAGLTQVQVSKKLQRPQSFVAKYERGERRLDLVEFLEVCVALQVDPKRVLTALQRHVDE